MDRELTPEEFNEHTNKIISTATANGVLPNDVLCSTAKALTASRSHRICCPSCPAHNTQTERYGFDDEATFGRATSASTTLAFQKTRAKPTIVAAIAKLMCLRMSNLQLKGR
jgi:hypothetical protein